MNFRDMDLDDLEAAIAGNGTTREERHEAAREMDRRVSGLRSYERLVARENARDRRR